MEKHCPPRDQIPEKDVTYTPLPAPKSALHQTVRHVATARMALGLSRAAIDYLRRATECVAPGDLTDGRTPWCYERVDDMALMLGVDPRTVRNIEKRLHDLGLIERKPMANGHRWAKRCRRTGEILWVHGISLKPLIERREELTAMATRIADRERAYRATRQQVHALRARLKETLVTAQEFSSLTELRDRTWSIYDAAPVRVTRQVFDLETLGRIRTELAIALDALTEALDIADESNLDSVDIKVIDDETSDASEILFLHKYDTIPNMYFCSRANAQTSLEKKEAKRKTKLKRHTEPQITAKGLLDLAPERWRDALNGVETIDWQTVGFVAAARRAELAVSDHAWRTGIDQMGPRRAAICLALLDTNRDHPTKPVRSVGGAFVAMTRRAETGTLHLEPSIRWIAARRAGVEPRTIDHADA